MPGIVVGIDGSANARSALLWAASEAAAHGAPLTVLTVHEISHSFWTGRPVVLSADEDQLAAAKAAATELADKAVSELGGARPAMVTVRAINGFAADELVAAAKGADMLVLGAAGEHRRAAWRHIPRSVRSVTRCCTGRRAPSW